MRDELKLSLAAVTVLGDRYLRRDERGRPVESTGEMMDRATNCVAAGQDSYQPGSSAQWAERFSRLLRGLEFLPNSPTPMNAGSGLVLLADVLCCPSIHCVQFSLRWHSTEIQPAGGGTGHRFTHLRPAGIG